MEPKNQKAELLEKVAKEIKTCKNCHLSRTRTNAVPGEGDINAEIMFVGEAPGYHEDNQARPFVGQAGKLLDNLLRDIGLERKKVYITNIVKCRPPENRDPEPDEINTCIPYLLKQIEIIKPKVICTLGRFSFAEMLERKVFISSEHGRPFKTSPTSRIGAGINIFPLYHPAAALHQPNLLNDLKEDFVKLHNFLISPPPEKKEIQKEKEEKKEKQMDLFT